MLNVPTSCVPQSCPGLGTEKIENNLFCPVPTFYENNQFFPVPTFFCAQSWTGASYSPKFYRAWYK